LSICLNSLIRATQTLKSEIIIVDNASADGTPDMVAQYYPQFKLIRNRENLGFAKSNNIGIHESSSDKILLLNPDTIVFSSSLIACLRVLENESETGAVGIRMMDACGNYLPESKRGVPTPWRSFSKLSGLWRLGPDSKFLAGYYWGGLKNKSKGNVEILSGAFLMFDQAKLGADFLLDESFFMFGEDIDFSYRILQKGFKNKYLGDVFIIHFKGESSDKNDPGYLRNFFGAMQLFRQKHFSNGGLGFIYQAGIKIFQSIRFAIPKKGLKKNISSIDTCMIKENIRGQAHRVFSNSPDLKGGDWVVLDGSSGGFGKQFLKLIETNPKGTIIWEHHGREFFVSPGKGERGWVVKPE
jgi:GT2 family glycosyltransferase